MILYVLDGELKVPSLWLEFASLKRPVSRPSLYTFTVSPDVNDPCKVPDVFKDVLLAISKSFGMKSTLLWLSKNW